MASSTSCWPWPPTIRRPQPGEPITVAFTPGPFNWEDYKTRLDWFPWHVAHRDGGVIYERDGIRLEVLDYLSKSRGVEIPLAFDPVKENPHLRQVQVQLTVDGQSEKFWLAGLSHDPVEMSFDIPDQQKVKVVSGSGRRVAISLEADWFPLGATIYLRNAWRKLDPGTMMPSYYASEIDLTPNLPADHKIDGKLTAYEDLLVTLNAPLDFTDPASGLSYRMFQSGMNGPLDPSDWAASPARRSTCRSSRSTMTRGAA